ncbi:MAG: hypothetical protein WC700_14395 [Gemmatimonadaceae bacterium]|jgi:hypothetical protein
MAHAQVPEAVDGKMTGRMLYFDESGHPIEPVTASAVDGVDAVMLELEAPILIVPDDVPVDEPAAPEVAPSPEED